MSETYQRLAEIAVDFRPRGAWAFLSTQADVRRLPRDTGRVLVGLRECFSDEQLATVGLLVRTDSGESEFCANIQARPGIFVALRAAADQTPYDILGPCGSLAGQGTPVLTAAADYYTGQMLRNCCKRLFVAFDIGAVAILRCLGLPVTLADGLDRLDGAGLRGLLGELRALPQDQARSQASGCTQGAAFWNVVDKLVLVGWSIARLDTQKPRGLQAVATLFGGAHHCFDFNTSRIVVWRPTKFQLQQIQYAVRLQDVELVRRAIVHSVASSLRPIEHYANDSPAVPVREEFRQARETLMAELRHEQEQQMLSIWTPRLLQKYSRSFERAFVDPLVQEALSVDSLIDQALSLAASELVQQLHNMSPIVTGCTEHASRTRVPWAVPMDVESQKQWLKIVDRIIAIERARRK